MSNLSQAERDKLPADSFCGPSRTYPILDAEDVASAARLIGMASDGARAAIKSCVIGKAKANSWSLPDTWKDSADHSGGSCPVPVAAFGTTPPMRIDGDDVIRHGKLFNVGSFPDKQFDLSPEEMWLAVESFTAVPVDLEHTPTVLQSKLGTLERIEQSSDGSVLYGDVRLPKWLDDLLGDDERKVSCTWDRATKRLTGLALVRTPRIADAALMAAFAGARHSAADTADMQQIHDLACGQGAECDSTKGNEMPSTTEVPNTEQTMMNKFFGWLTAGAPAGTPVATAPATFSAPATSSALVAPVADPEKDTLKAQLAQLRAQQIGDRAAAFAAEQITANKALPAQRDAIIAAYSVMASDDAEHGQATFATGKVGRVDTLAALFTNAPVHTLLQEQVPVDPANMRQLPTPGQLTGTAARFSDGKVDNAEVLRLLGTDPVGKTILRDMALTAATAGGKAGK